jgi:hypothetical protein
VNAADVERSPGSAAARAAGCTCDRLSAEYYATLTGVVQHFDECDLADVGERVVYPEPEHVA